ncbi:MAG: NAD-dependent epimerase/dehydratase family protein [Planctomycetota bacterium]
MIWKNRNVLVTGGSSFIGSHLVDALVERNASVRVVDKTRNNYPKYIKPHIDSGKVDFSNADLLEPEVARKAVKNIDVIFHLAAVHGGRDYIENHQADCAKNLAIDGLLFHEAHLAEVEKIVFASSACVYPNYLQKDSSQEVILNEEIVKHPYDAQNIYGWAKLMGELTLKAYAKEYGMKTASCRYFSVYGPRGKEDHAVIAITARAYREETPFVVWGDGQQVRNWTYVEDIVKGTILTAEKIDNGTAVNIGTAEKTKVIDVVNEVLRYTGHKAQIELHPEMPTGPVNCVADISLAKKILGWEPEYKFIDGLHKTIDWYFSTRS